MDCMHAMRPTIVNYVFMLGRKASNTSKLLVVSRFVSEILSLISPNLKTSRDSEHIPFGSDISRVH